MNDEVDKPLIIMAYMLCSNNNKNKNLQTATGI